MHQLLEWVGNVPYMEPSDLAERLLLLLPCNYKARCHYASARPCKSRALDWQAPNDRHLKWFKMKNKKWRNSIQMSKQKYVTSLLCATFSRKKNLAKVSARLYQT